MRLFALAFVLALFLLVAAAPARAELLVEGGYEATLHLRAAATGYEATAKFPFAAPGNGLVYAKLLPMPGNAVNDGTWANGTVSKGEGVSGWWTTMSFWSQGGGVLAGSAPAARVDGTPTDAVKTTAGSKLALHVLVHAPADAFLHAAEYKVLVVLAFRPAQESTRGSGGMMDDAVALRMAVFQSAAALPGTDKAPKEETKAPSTTKNGDAGRGSAALSPLLVGASLGAVAIIGGAVVLSAFRGSRGPAPGHDGRYLGLPDASRGWPRRCAPWSRRR